MSDERWGPLPVAAEHEGATPSRTASGGCCPLGRWRSGPGRLAAPWLWGMRTGNIMVMCARMVMMRTQVLEQSRNSRNPPVSSRLMAWAAGLGHKVPQQKTS